MVKQKVVSKTKEKSTKPKPARGDGPKNRLIVSRKRESGSQVWQIALSSLRWTVLSQTGACETAAALAAEPNADPVSS